MFHFNKANITNPQIPPWILKIKGETYQVQHVNSSAPWSTKETPDNPHTKGALKFKHVDVEIEDGIANIIPCQERGCLQ